MMSNKTCASEHSKTVQRAPVWNLTALLLLLFLLALIATMSTGCSERKAPATAANHSTEAQFVGSERCATCHAEQTAAWHNSQHRVAMQPVTEQSVLAPFAGESVRSHGVASSFFRRDDQYWVRTTDANGQPQEFKVTHTFGVAPLQQYLVELGGGRLQALGLSWDARPAASGGQRWFDLYPASVPGSGDPMHWSGHEHNWNYMCADCHATNVRKNYDTATDTYKTTWSELGAGCEACHGPASRHVVWAEQGARTGAGQSNGLLVSLHERRGASWPRDEKTGQPRRVGPQAEAHELDICARCHSLRSQLTDAVTAADPLAQGFHMSLLEPGQFWPDGQMRDEVYNIASFLQSRMHSAGVVCSDCHDPHSQKLRVPGDGVCLQCHEATRYTATTHHMHDTASSGARCAACHMPVHTYMQIDQRHDHSLRIPQPALSASLGAPNACTGCHRDRSAAWAEQVIARAHPQRATSFQTFGPAFANLQNGKPGAAEAVLAIFRDPAQPAIVRASALQHLADAGITLESADLRNASRDVDPLVRAAVAPAAAGNADVMQALLGDSLRAVRIAAVTGLTQQTDITLPPGLQSSFSAAKDEYLNVLRFNSDRPEARSTLGQVLASSRDTSGAIAAYQGAIKLDRGYTGAYLGLADTYRMLGDEASAERELRTAIASGRDGKAAARLALGLLQYRQGKKDATLASFAEAMRLEPDNLQVVYTYAVALHDLGQPAEALRVIQRALTRHPDAAALRQLLEAYSEASAKPGRVLR